MKISNEEFERLKKAPKAEILKALSRFVGKPRGRKRMLEDRPLSGYERLKRYREKQQREAAKRTRKK